MGRVNIARALTLAQLSALPGLRNVDATFLP